MPTRSLVACLLALAVAGPAAAAQEPKTEEQKVIYALGLAIAQSLAGFRLNYRPTRDPEGYELSLTPSH